MVTQKVSNLLYGALPCLLVAEWCSVVSIALEKKWSPDVNVKVMFLVTQFYFFMKSQF